MYNTQITVGMSVFMYGMGIFLLSMAVTAIFFGAEHWPGSQAFLVYVPDFVASMLLSGAVAKCLRPRIQRMRRRGLYADDDDYSLYCLEAELMKRGIRIGDCNDKEDFAFCGFFIRQYLCDTYEDSLLVYNKDITDAQRQNLRQGIETLACDTAKIIADGRQRRDKQLNDIEAVGRAGITAIEQDRADRRRLTTQTYADEVIRRRNSS